MVQDVITERQAYIIAHQYGLVPFTDVKCERTVPEGTIRTLFFCNTAHHAKVFVKYDRDELDDPDT